MRKILLLVFYIFLDLALTGQYPDYYSGLRPCLNNPYVTASLRAIADAAIMFS
jgi:hypothetical protein